MLLRAIFCGAAASARYSFTLPSCEHALPIAVTLFLAAPVYEYALFSAVPLSLAAPPRKHGLGWDRQAGGLQRVAPFAESLTVLHLQYVRHVAFLRLTTELFLLGEQDADQLFFCI